MAFDELTGHGRLAGRGAWHAPWLMTAIVKMGNSAHAMRPYKSR
jgi:hypothetical protein